MNCEDTMKFSFAYLDGEFDARDKIEFEAHLSMCGPCREAVEVDARFRKTVRKHLVAPPMDPELRERVQARLSSARRQARLSRTLTVPLALAASFALAVVAYRGLSTNEANKAEITVAAAAPIADEVAKSPAESGAVQVAVAAPARPRPEPTIGAAPTQPAAAGNIRQVAEERRVRAGALTGVRGHADAGDWPIVEARSPASLKAMVKMHAAPLPYEVQGDAAAVQAYLRARMRDVGPPPISEGTGVHIHGARFSQVAGHPVVVYRYAAFGKAVTAIRFLKDAGKGPFDEPSAAGTPGRLEGTLDDNLAGYTVLHVLRDGTRYALVSELELEPMQALLAE